MATVLFLKVNLKVVKDFRIDSLSCSVKFIKILSDIFYMCYLSIDEDTKDPIPIMNVDEFRKLMNLKNEKVFLSSIDMEQLKKYWIESESYFEKNKLLNNLENTEEGLNIIKFILGESYLKVKTNNSELFSILDSQMSMMCFIILSKLCQDKQKYLFQKKLAEKNKRFYDEELLRTVNQNKLKIQELEQKINGLTSECTISNKLIISQKIKIQEMIKLQNTVLNSFVTIDSIRKSSNLCIDIISPISEYINKNINDYSISSKYIQVLNNLNYINASLNSLVNENSTESLSK